MSKSYGFSREPDYATSRDLKYKLTQWIFEETQVIEDYEYFEGHTDIEVTPVTNLQFQVSMKPANKPRRYFIVQVKERLQAKGE